MTDPETVPAEHKKAQIARINELSQLARTAWFTLLAYLVFVGVTLLGVQDADFFLASRRTQLPLAGVEIPTASFFWTAPILGAALYTYLHLFLIKLWDAHVPPTSDADPTHHWLVNDFVLVRQGDPAARARPLAWLTSTITIFLVWVAGPLVLAYAWWRSMPAHDERMTLLIAACLWITLVVGFTSWFLADERLARRRRTPWGVWWRRAAAAVVALLLFATSWMRTEGGLDDYVDGAWTLEDVTLTIPADSSVFRWWLDDDLILPLARTDLAGVEMVDLPDAWRTPETARAAFRATWCGREGLSMTVCDHSPSSDRPAPVTLQADRKKWCDERRDVLLAACLAQFDDLDRRFNAAWREERNAALTNLPKLDLAGRDLRSADARQVSLVHANLDGARLEKAQLGNARLEGADLSQAQLERTFLGGAQLEEANLREARLEGAYLGGARLDGANLSEARMEGASFDEARLEGANLSRARLEGANLSRAQLEGANLWNARLDGANLTEARLEGAYLLGARLEAAYLGGARLEGADLRFADFRKSSWAAEIGPPRPPGQPRRIALAVLAASPVQFADFRGSQYLTQAQLEAVIGDKGTLLPDGPSDTGEPWYVWSCWESPPPNLDRLVATAADADADRARLRAKFLCGPGNPRRKTGTPLALDAPYPEGHPLAGRVSED